MEKRIKLFFSLFLLFVIFFALATDLPIRQNRGFFSDESGYFSIIQSLAYDLDIRYQHKDLLRIQETFPAGPTGFFLKKTGPDGYYFAKSFAYPMVAAPFFALFSFNGILLLNGLMLFFSILMAYYLLKQFHPDPRSLGFSMMFILASVTPVYIWWMTADLFNFFVMFAGLFFFFYQFKRPWLFYISGIFFTLSAFSKPWNVVAIGIVYLILLFRKKWRRFAILSAISIVLFSGCVAFLVQQTGEFSYSLFQGGERRSFDFNSGYPYQHIEVPAEKEGEPARVLTAEEIFERGNNMSFDGFWGKYDNSPHILVSNLFYYFFGRFTGMFIYFFPACFVLFLFFFQRKTAEDWFVLTAIITAILIYTQMATDNYFGGSGSVGNRYFFNIFPLFFFLGFRSRAFKYSFIQAVIGLIFLSGIYADSFNHSATPRLAGLSFPIRLFPPEKTQYLSLPTNENPRAYGKLMHDGEKTYQLYLLNDNYHEIRGDSFWTNGNKQLEFFLSIDQEVKEFRVELRSGVENNPVRLDVEYKYKRVKLRKMKPYIAKFKNIGGLKIKGKYVYYFKVKSDRYKGGANEPLNPDKRKLGVQVHIGVNY